MSDSICTTTPPSIEEKNEDLRTFQFLNLNNDNHFQEDVNLKDRLQEAQAAMDDLQKENHGTLAHELGPNENVIVETKTIALEDELKQKDVQIRNLEEKCADLEAEKAEIIRNSEEVKKADEDHIKVLEEQLLAKTNENQAEGSEKSEENELMKFSVKIIEETMSGLKQENEKLKEESMEKDEWLSKMKEELEDLKCSMKSEIENSEQAAKYLEEENMKLTRQKADLRCELLETRRKLESLEKNYQDYTEKQRLEAQEDMRQICELKKDVDKEVAQSSEQIEKLQRNLADFENIKKEYHSAKQKLSISEKKVAEMGKCLEMADQQITHYKALYENCMEENSSQKQEFPRSENLQLKLSQRESELRSSQNSTLKMEQMLEKSRLEHQKVHDENLKLRKGMADALDKIEEYKSQCQEAKDKTLELELELASSKNNRKVTFSPENKTHYLEVEEDSKDEEEEKEDEEVEEMYTQIIKQNHETPKREWKRNLPKSPLTSPDGNLDTSVFLHEIKESRDFEEERLKAMSSLRPSRTSLSKSQYSVSPRQSEKSPSTGQPTTKVLSHHETPHAWKDFTHISLFSMKCSFCFREIKPLSSAEKCAHCDVRVHPTCSPRVNNTCGMREESTERMNGWIKFYKSGQSNATWIDSWAMMDQNRISFYTDYGANLEKPFFSIDLSQENWSLKTHQQNPIDSENVLMIKLPRRSIYILAPCKPSAKRWEECLLNSQKKRINSEKSSIAEFTCLLELKSPNNLKIFEAHIIEEWILFATETGLYFTNVSEPKTPIRIAGPTSVTSMEIMTEINCVAMIDNKEMAMIPMKPLTIAMQSSHPSIEPEFLSEFGQVHGIRYHQQNGQKFLVISDDSHLHIRKYSSTKDIFVNFAKLPVPEPVTYIESAPNGILFASDTFYYVSLNHLWSSNIYPQQLVPPRGADYPISAHVINPDEILLAYQNHGIFVTFDGQETGKKTIQWEKMPLEFKYTAPFLYIVHTNFMEILRISDGEKETFECVNAHIIGQQKEDVLVSVSSEEATEVHKFMTNNCYEQPETSIKAPENLIFETPKRPKNKLLKISKNLFL